METLSRLIIKANDDVLTPLRELFGALFVRTLDRDASVADYRERVFDVDIWSPIFVRDGFVKDDILVTFFDKLNEAKLGDSLRDIVR